MSSLSSMKFQSFKLKNLGVKIYKGKSYNSSDITIADDIDSVNYITRTEQNNGIKVKVLNENFEHIECGNAITIGDTTATVFYQKDSFIVGEHIVILRADWFNELTAMFLVVQLRKESFRYPPFARAFTKDLISETEVLMPVRDGLTNIPDYQKIEELIKSYNITSDNISDEMPDYFLSEGYKKACWYLDNINQKDFEKKYSKEYLCKKILLRDRVWKEFALIDYFKPVQSKGDIKTSEIVEGNIPLVSATKENNGIVAHILFGDGIAETFTAGCLTADMFGHVYYQPDEFYAVSHGRVNILIPKIKINQHIGIFVAKILEYQFSIRNSYSRMLTSELLAKCKMLLPTKLNDANAPDWEFMENYIKSLPFSCNI